jgi:hypothetical protein
MTRRSLASVLALALGLLPAACLCTPVPVHAVEAPVPPCHGGGDERAPAAPEHDAACSHCHVAANVPADHGGAPSLTAAPAQPVVLARVALDTVALGMRQVPPPPADARRQRTCVLLI